MWSNTQSLTAEVVLEPDKAGTSEREEKQARKKDNFDVAIGMNYDVVSFFSWFKFIWYDAITSCLYVGFLGLFRF